MTGFLLYSTKLTKFVIGLNNNYLVSTWGKLLQKAMGQAHVVLLVVHLETCTLGNNVDA
jgi:hypothetical protein